MVALRKMCHTKINVSLRDNAINLMWDNYHDKGKAIRLMKFAVYTVK